MTSKGGPDNPINERRLRPIYDCLDNGNNKKALQEAEKLLKKQKEHQSAKVLKCLALIRLGQLDKCLPILLDVYNEGPTDDCTLQTMAVCYKELNMTHCIADMYEKALEKRPRCEELMTSLFLSYVRLGNFKKQQQAALNLYKLNPAKNIYYFWAIMSVYMQAITAKDQEICNKMLLPLAEKMCKKIIDDDKITCENELQVYLMILEKQQNYAEMLKVMNGPLSKYLTDYLEFLKRRKSSLLLKVGLHQEAFEALRNLIDVHVDQLEYYLLLCDTAFTLDQKLLSNHEESSMERSSDELKKDAQYQFSFIKRAIDIISRHLGKIERPSYEAGKKSCGKHLHKNPVFRAPYLARIEILEMLSAKLESNPHYSYYISCIGLNFTDLLFNYYLIFGNKEVCYFDLAYLLNKYKKPNSDVVLIIERIKSSRDPRKKELACIDEMYRYLCLVKLEHYARQTEKLNDFERDNLAAELIEYYDQCLKFGPKTQVNDFHPVDSFMSILFNILVEKAIREDAYFLSLVTILERSLKKSPSNYVSKLSLIKLYNAVGASLCSQFWFESMDVKHLQQDTLGYLIFDALMMAGLYMHSLVKINHASKFYNANTRDSFDYLVSFYKVGNFCKIEEIIKLTEKLSYSINNASIELDKILLNLILMPKNPQSILNAISSCDNDFDKMYSFSEKFCDNRDFAVFRVYDPLTKEKMDKNQKRYLQDQTQWIRLRCLLMKTIIAVSNLIVRDSPQSSDSGNGLETSNGSKPESDDFPDFLEQLKSFYDSLRDKSLHFEILPLQGSQPSRINYFLTRKYLDVILDLLDELKKIYYSAKENETSLGNSWLDLLKELTDHVMSDLKNTDSLSSIRKCLADTCNLVETFCFVTVILGLIHEFLKRDLVSVKKNRKKNKSEISIFNSLIEQFNYSLFEVDKISRTLIDFLSTKEWGELLNLSPEPKIFKTKDSYLLDHEGYSSTFKEILKKLEQSYRESSTELTAKLSTKLKYLNSLKL